MSSSSNLARELAALERRVGSLEREPKLQNSSLEGTALPVYDRDGLLRQTIGELPDGTYGVEHFNGTPPPAPSLPTVVDGITSLAVEWDGLTDDGSVWPRDFARVEVHVSTVSGFTPTDATQVSAFYTTRGGRAVIPDLAVDVIHYVALVAVNTSGTESAKSTETAGTPFSAAGDTSALEQRVTDAEAAADNAVAIASGKTTRHFTDTEPAGPHAHGDVWTSPAADYSSQMWDDTANAGAGGWVSFQYGGDAFAANSILSAHIAAGEVKAGNIAAGAVETAKLDALAVTAAKIAANAIEADKINAGAVTAAKIDAGAVTADKLEADMVLATRILAGDPLAARVELTPTGLGAYASDGTQTFDVDGTTGDVFMTGVFRSNPVGVSRVEIGTLIGAEIPYADITNTLSIIEFEAGDGYPTVHPGSITHATQVNDVVTLRINSGWHTGYEYAWLNLQSQNFIGGSLKESIIGVNANKVALGAMSTVPAGSESTARDDGNRQTVDAYGNSIYLGQTALGFYLGQTWYDPAEIMLDGKTLFGRGEQWLIGFDCGYVSSAGASGGNHTVNHTLGVTPTVVIATPGTEGHVAAVRNRTDTSFIVGINDHAGANVTGAVDFFWIALATEPSGARSYGSPVPT